MMSAATTTRRARRNQLDLEAPEEPAARRFPAARMITHLTPEQRVARGRAARTEVPRESHGVFRASERRPDPVALLEQQATTRDAELVPIRHGRMLVSPFTFYRGAAFIMAADLASTPVSGIHAQLCGDAHLSNFGAFGSPERRLMFDVNDFDETSPGPWEWDVKRLVASLEVGGRDNGYAPDDRQAMVQAAAAEYCRAMAGFAGMGNLDVWYSRADVEGLLPEIRKNIDPDRFKLLEANLAKARSRDSMQAFSKMTREVDGIPRIISNPPLIVPLREVVEGWGLAAEYERLEQDLLHILRAYRSTLETDRRHLLEQYRLVELARKVVGVGSVGTRAWMGLYLGRDGTDPLFLQMKQAEEGVLERFAGFSEYRNHGQRVVAGQRLMQATSDIFLGWTRVVGVDGVTRDYYIRQLRDWKWSVDPGMMVPRGMTVWGRLCAWTLARAHARSGDRIAIAAYLGKGKAFEKAMVAFARAYADQNERDYNTFAAAVKAGRLQAETGV